MSKIKQLLQDFKKFITRGNVVDMAVAVIIGGAFNAIVTSLTNNIIKPLINWVIALAVGGNSIGLITMLKPVYISGVAEDGTTTKVLDMTASIYIDWSTFIMKIIDFLLIALVLFVIVKVFMQLKSINNEIVSKDRRDIRKRARVRAKEQCIKYKDAVKQIEAEILAELEAKKEPPKPTAEELLTQIKDLMAVQVAMAEEEKKKKEEAEAKAKAEAEAGNAEEEHTEEGEKAEKAEEIKEVKEESEVKSEKTNDSTDKE